MKQLYTQQQQDEGKKNKNTDRRWARAERARVRPEGENYQNNNCRKYYSVFFLSLSFPGVKRKRRSP